MTTARHKSDTKKVTVNLPEETIIVAGYGIRIILPS